MNKFNDLSIARIAEILIEKGYEGEYWDYKQEWHENIEDLIKDIICFANTPHEENGYLLFGVDDNGNVVGMKKSRRKQADILDRLDTLLFAGDVKPEISVETIVIKGTEIDVLIVYNTQKTPIYLKKKYGKMYEGCVYMRDGDKNTPNNGMASIEDVEKLWKKRFGLLQTPLDYILDRLQYPLEWKQQGYTYYNMYRPEYQLKILKEDDEQAVPEYYAYTMTNKNVSYEQLKILAGNTVLDEYQLVVLDGGRYRAPTPEWGYCGYDQYRVNSKFTYKYFVMGSGKYRLYRFFLENGAEEAICANGNLMRVVLVYETENEREKFETYVEEHQEEIVRKINEENLYSYIKATNEFDTEECIRRIHTGLALNDLLGEWRDQKRL